MTLAEPLGVAEARAGGERRVHGSRKAAVGVHPLLGLVAGVGAAGHAGHDL
jgi:hypothetical protein